MDASYRQMGCKVGPTLRAICVFAIGLAATSFAAAEEAIPAAGIEFFEKKIRPLLVEHCQQCHGDNKQENGLVLTSAAEIFKGGDRGSPVVAGQPADSLLIKAVSYADDDLKMPPRGKLKEEQIADLVAWIKMGAPVPKEGNEKSAGKVATSEFKLSERRRHWAYQPIARAQAPLIQNSEFRIQNPIDAFIAARLMENGLSQAPPADKRTLVRRLTFDLTGLPPPPAEVQAFADDHSPDAYEKLVDRLLASPRYGERWGRHWLDIVRYSETMGFEFDYDLYNAWRYRDYVIRAFNDDLPYDQFVVEHLAGDLVPAPRRHPIDQCNESVLATGFFWMVEGKQTPVDIRQEQADKIDNQIDALSKALLGQTVACARCHDHKFDAITTRDYYALAGYIKSSRYQQAFLDPPGHLDEAKKEIASLQAQIAALPRAALAAAWQPELAQAGHYLLAAASAVRAARSAESAEQAADRTKKNSEKKDRSARGLPRSALESAAREFGVEISRLEKWVKALGGESLQSMDHPLYLWSKSLGEERLNAARLRDALAEQQAKAARVAANAQPWNDFHKHDFGRWYVTGDAFALGPASIGNMVLGSQPERPLARLSLGGADSGLISHRLQGELRSSTFTIAKRYVHFRVAGDQARVNLVIDGNTLIMNPMYGKLTIPLAGEGLVWWTMPVDRWVGHRAYIEVSDCTIPPQRLNPPPSTARVPENDSDGYAILEQVLFSDDAEPPLLPHPLNAAVLERVAGALRAPTAVQETSSGLAELKAIATAYQEVITEDVTLWSSNRSNLSADQHRLVLLNWLLENGLLDTSFANHDLPRLADRYRAIESSLPTPRRAPALADGTGEDEFVFLRGNYHTLGQRAERGPLEMLGDVAHTAATIDSLSLPPESISPFAGSGRLELAQKLVDPSNPLLSRVIVNRIWQHHFGNGIVRTPDDFGRMGLPPSHPELLDWLASELIRRNWSLKAVHRRMLETSAYRQASAILDFKLPILDSEGRSNEPENLNSKIQNPKSVDPENRLLHHMPLRRLEAEAVRDSILAVSGQLNTAAYGPSVLPYLTPYMEGRGRPNSGPLDGEGRRSVYINARRNFLTPLLLAFDYPVTFTCIGRRSTSTIPAQALTLMNDPFVVEQAGQWAQRVLANPNISTHQRIESLYQVAFARAPTADELADAIDFLQEQSLRHRTGSNDPRVWADLCHVLINLKEFIFIE